MKLISSLLFLFIIATTSAQNITISGKVIERTTKLPVEAATVFISSVKDSSLISYTITDRNGSFTLPTKSTDTGVLFQVSFIGFKTINKLEKLLTSDVKYGVLEMEEDANLLNEVVVLGEAPPIRVKKDTL